MMEQPFTFKLMLITVAFFTASCSNFGEETSRQESQLEQLGTAIDHCLEVQANNHQQLAAQKEQLDTMMVTLTEIQQRPDPQEASATAVPAPACPPPAAVAAPVTGLSKMMVGQLEQVWLQDLQLALPARIDTGAETASLDARNIEMFERNSKNWVRFEIVHPETGEPLQLERRLKRTALILQANSSEAERRPVIKLAITIGQISQSAEFTLSNRSHLDYQILVGRNILKDVMIVDVSKENLAPLPEQPPETQAKGAGTP